MMWRMFLVYLIIVVALFVACRFLYRKIKALRKRKSQAPCDACPLKKQCHSIQKQKKTANGCCPD